MINVEQIKLNRPINTNKKTSISIIKSLNYSCINNIKICNKIKEIPYNIIRYDIIQKCTPVKIREITKRGKITEIPLIDNEENLVQLQYDNKKYDYQYFVNYLNEIKSFKILFLTILESYTFLSESIELLNKNGICYLNLNKDNIIIYNSYIDFYPLLINFSNSIYFENGSVDNNKDIYNFIINNDYPNLYPLELYVISYLNEHGESLSYSSIETICNRHIENTNINCLHILSETYRTKYYNSSIDFLKQYINKPKQFIINELLKYWRTWDMYSIGIFYLYIVGNIKRTLNLKETVVDNFIYVLNININPNPLNRNNKLLNLSSSWNFINEITDEIFDKSNLRFNRFS